jgi:DNA-binding response OmpR family regulator
MARIIMLEPDVVLAKTYREVLEQAGHEVCVCREAQEAVFSVDDAKPAVILLELQLVGHSGIEFLYELRSYADWRDIPVIILSNVPPYEFNSNAELLRGTLGVKEYCYKPQTSLAEILALANRFAPVL